MLINNNEYFELLEDIKTRIKTAQYRAVLGANKELIELYWNIGKIIIDNTKYGSKFIENLARDIKTDFPNSKGFSVRNLKYMRKFAAFIPDEIKVQTVSALLTWSHNTHLFDKAKTLDEYLWYATQTIENGWSLSSLEYHVETNTYQRQVTENKAANYKIKLPQPQSNLVIETLKNPYVFDFVEQRDGILEGASYNFDIISSVLDKYEIEDLNEYFILVGLVQNKKTADDFFRDFKKYDTEDDWTYHWSDEDLRDYAVGRVVPFNREWNDILMKYGFTIYDTSTEREQIFDKIIEDIKLKRFLNIDHYAHILP